MSALLRKIAYHILTDKDSDILTQLENIESVSQANSYAITFEGENLVVNEKYRYSDTVYTHEEEYETEVAGLPYMEDYDEGERFTGFELRVFLAENPNLVAEVDQKRRDNIGKIAELNKEVGRLIDEMTELAEEANIDVTINLGQHGSLDPNSDWDSSRC